MKFDFVIGNPPYQETVDTYNRQEPIYPHFYDAAEKISERYLLISPARFLFDSGLTKKAWNNKMLNDEHIVVEKYYRDSSEVFANTNINGGVVVLYRDSTKRGKPISFFVPDEILRGLASKFKGESQSLMSIVYGGRSDLKFNGLFIKDFPETKKTILRHIQKKHPDVKQLGPNEEFEIKSSSFERTPYAFLDEKPNEDCYRVLGIENGKRLFKWVKHKYLEPRYPERNNLTKYKVFVSNADGAAGQIGKPIPARIIGKVIIGRPNDTSIPTFLSIGNFDTEEEARNLQKYLSTKFVRALVGILKVTQHITPQTWLYVPLQNFSNTSDINWNTTASNLDKQLFKKYSLSQDEVDFIEKHVKEMA